jgi:hypothetical protein
MPTVEEYKIGILRQLAELTAQGREPVLQLRTTPVDEAIRGGGGARSPRDRRF